MAITKPVTVGLIGAGRIGSFHAATIARRIPDASLLGIADPAPGAAARLATELGAPVHTTDVAGLLANPDLDAVIIASPARSSARRAWSPWATCAARA